MIHLWRTVAVRTFDAEATIALGRNRPELLAVARLAADAGRPIMARDVARELLAGVPDHVGRLVIERAVHVGLLVPHDRGVASLSDSGRTALENGKVLVPEEGAFRLYYADDPLLPIGLLHVSPLRLPNAPDARKSMREARDGGQRIIEQPVPRTLGTFGPGGVLFSAVNRAPFEVVVAPKVGLVGPQTSLRLDLRWPADEAPRVQLSGELPAPGPDDPPLAVDVTVNASDAIGDLGYDEVWCGLVSHATGVSDGALQQWHRRTQRRVLPVAFRDASEAARRAFTQDLEVPGVDYEGLGSFEPTRIQKVDLVPASDSDAQEWCHWLQWDAVGHGYATPSVLEAAAATARARFPNHAPRPLTPNELLARAMSSRTDRRSWNLLAPADLGLWSNA